jgi:chromosome segregation ATPase
MINKEINELRTKIDNIKEETTQDMENLRKKNEIELQNKMEDQSSRIEQTEDRISELKDEMVIKGKTEDLLIKQLKTCEKKMRELTDSIKRPNLRIMGRFKKKYVQFFLFSAGDGLKQASSSVIRRNSSLKSLKLILRVKRLNKFLIYL